MERVPALERQAGEDYAINPDGTITVEGQVYQRLNANDVLVFGNQRSSNLAGPTLKSGAKLIR